MIDNVLMIFSIWGLVLAIVAGCILLFSNKIDKHSNRLLALLLGSLACVFLSIFLFEWEPKVYAYIYRIPSPFLYVLFPSFYLYTRSIVHGDTEMMKKDFIHFMPAALYLIEILPHLFSSYAHRMQLVIEIKNHPGLLIYLNEGFLPRYCNIAFLLLQSTVYILLTLRLLNKTTLLKKQMIKVIKRSAYQWTRFFALASASIAIPLVLLILSPEQFSASALQGLLVITILCFLTAQVFLFFKPRILYGIFQAETVSSAKDFHQHFAAGVESLKTKQHHTLPTGNSINTGKLTYPEFSNLNYYRTALEDYMHTAKPFLIQGYSIQDLSRDTNIPQHHLSHLLNRVYKLRFTDYINGLRIQFIAAKFGDPEWENLTLEGIAKQAGFTSRTTFFNAIKKVSGLTPSEFMARVKAEQSKTSRIKIK